MLHLNCKENLSAFLLTIGIVWSTVSMAQVPGKNIITNGSFEEGNTGFESSYYYSPSATPPGYYSITDVASSLHKDFKDPVGGDHTEGGYGLYFVANSNGGSSSQNVWCSKVQIVPNAEYNFSVYFCNLYRLLPPKTNFAFESGDVKGNDPKIRVTIGEDVILVEQDYFHLFKWLRAASSWYSGEHNGPVRICIENLNTNINGNDLALDDISLVYIRTMPEGFKPPEKITTHMHQDYTKPVVVRKVPLSEYGIVKGQEDSINSGVYSIQYKSKMIPVVEKDTMSVDTIQRIVLKNILFMQSKSDLLPLAKKELDIIADWLKRDTEVRVRFIGHTDNQGDARLNVVLSQQRVQNVKAYLVSQGITAERIDTVGYGGAFPIADNKIEESRKMNRRVEMEIIK